MERKYSEATESGKGRTLLRMAYESFLSNLPILVCGLVVGLVVGAELL